MGARGLTLERCRPAWHVEVVLEQPERLPPDDDADVARRCIQRADRHALYRKSANREAIDHAWRHNGGPAHATYREGATEPGRRLHPGGRRG